MLTVFDCIAHEHDLRLVALAASIALFGSHTAIKLLRHVSSLTGASRLAWLAAAAVAAGSAIWATHFVAMLAFQPQTEVQYGVGLTVLSLVMAIVLTGMGFLTALSYPSWKVRATGGALVGLGIAGMHYTGMSAFNLPGYLTWDPALVAASLVIGPVFGAGALVLAFKQSKASGEAAATLLCLAICLLHFTGMAAVTIHFEGLLPNTSSTMAPTLLASNLALACVLILMLNLAAVQLKRRGANRSATEQANLLELADIAVEGLLVCDGPVVVTANDSFSQMTGLSTESLRGMQLDALFDGAPVRPRETASQHQHIERVLVSAKGERIPVEVVWKSILYCGRPHQVVALRDLRERRKAEEEIRFLAHHDPLTGLANRPSFGGSLGRQLSEQSVNQRPFALFALDLDRFKEVNDSLGHGMGDLLLKRVAGRLRATVRDTDCIARLGGDEFAILLSGFTTEEKTTALANRVVEIVRRPYILDGKIVNIGVSVGIAMAPRDGADAAELMKNADMALYRAKSDGRNTSRRYEPDMNELLQARRELELDLRRALAQGQLEVHYQPLYDVPSESVRGFEALARWWHPTRGSIPPADFVPLAEETGLISQLGEFVLNASMVQAMEWQAHVSISVNLSAAQFPAGNLVDMIRAALQRTGLEPNRLELEVTESVLLHEGADTLRTLHQLRELGVRIAMDDFGTGYSSLRYLRSFPFDRIKIDRSFIQEMLVSDESAAIISAVVALGRRLSISTTAEGVETEEQLARVKAEGCDTVQGFLIGRPVPGPETARFLRPLAVEAA